MVLNPVLRRFPNFAAYIIFWFLLAAINFIVLTAGMKLDIMYAATDSFVIYLILALLALSFWYPVKYIPFERAGFYKIIFSHLTASLAASALWISLSFIILVNIFSDTTYKDFLFGSLPWRFLSGIIFYFFIASLYYVITYYSELQEKNKKESELKNLITQAELRTLKFQINPHFLFNALNSLSALTLTDPEKARIITIKISDFLRYSLSNNEKQKNKLFEEINNIRLYLEIEKVRFENKFNFSEDIESECLDVEVPNMILQPLIENAFKHSVYEAIDPVDIKLICRKINNELQIILSNDYEDGSSSKKGAGVGLSNISDRLELLYNRKGLLYIKNEQGIFSVKIIIPDDKPAL